MDINNSLVSRFYSQIILEDFSVQDQEELLKKEITIIGCGGLGSPVSVYLAASGIGKINLVDPDKVEIRKDTPEDIKVAIETFFEATKMIKEGYVEKMPGEYVANLIDVLSKYPEYKILARELATMVISGVDNDV